MSYIDQYLADAGKILDRLDRSAIEGLVREIAAVRERGGRLFVIGSGGGAGHASHAVGDFRKLVGVEAYSPSDNVSELTARVNDDGWERSYVEWLKGSRLREGDLVFVLSVGGGDVERAISANLVRCVEHARDVGARICGVVGRDGGATARLADACVIIPVVNADFVTAQTESFQSLVWHLLVSHPDLRIDSMKWESLSP